MQETNLLKKSNAILPDPYADSVVLDLSAYSGSVVDAKGHTLANTNVVASATQKKWGPYSMWFNANAWLQIGNNANSDFWLQADFCIETWIYLVARTTQYPCYFNNYNVWPNANALGLFAGHQQRPTDYTTALTGTFPAAESTQALIFGAWSHLATVRSGSTITTYINGAFASSCSSSAALYGTKTYITIGNSADTMSNGMLNAYVERYRITNVARYTAPFTPQRF
uniref:Concanavalin A-like lectin/glucanase superfamily protein n=1 Tax=Burkholderia phage vB_BgluM-SURPRISE13 TaxID=3159457 RepID=A0AAU7PFB9_9VIRU